MQPELLAILGDFRLVFANGQPGRERIYLEQRRTDAMGQEAWHAVDSWQYMAIADIPVRMPTDQTRLLMALHILLEYVRNP